MEQQNFTQSQTLLFQLGAKAVALDVESFIDTLERILTSKAEVPPEIKARADANIIMIQQLAESLKPFQQKYKEVMATMLTSAGPKPVANENVGQEKTGDE